MILIYLFISIIGRKIHRRTISPWACKTHLKTRYHKKVFKRRDKIGILYILIFIICLRRELQKISSWLWVRFKRRRQGLLKEYRFCNCNTIHDTSYWEWNYIVKPYWSHLGRDFVELGPCYSALRIDSLIPPFWIQRNVLTLGFLEWQFSDCLIYLAMSVRFPKYCHLGS